MVLRTTIIYLQYKLKTLAKQILRDKILWKELHEKKINEKLIRC